MGLEAQEVAVRLRVLGGTAFKTQMDEAAGSIRNVGKAGAETDAALAGGGGASGFLGGTSKALDTVNGKLDSFSTKAHQVGRQTALLSIGSAGLLGFSVKEWADAQGQFKVLETQAHATVKQRKELEATAPGLAALGLSPKEVAEGYYPLQSVFHNVKQDIGGMKAAAAGALIGHDSITNTVEAMTSAMRVGSKDVHGYAEEMALLDETVGAGKLHLPELNKGFTTGTFQVAASLGLSQRSVLAALASESQTTAFGGVNQFLTRFRTAILKGIGLKGEAEAAASKLGISKNMIGEDFHGPEGFITMLRQLKAGMAKLGTGPAAETEGNRMISEMFGGSRSAGIIISALRKLPTDESIYNRLNKVHGSKTLEEHLAQTQETGYAKLKELKSEAKVFLYELGVTTGPIAVKVLGSLVHDLHALGEMFKALLGPMKSFVVYGLGAVALLSPAAFVLSGLARAAKLLLSPLKMLGPEAGAAELGLGGLAATLGTGGAFFLAIEALNRLLGGKHWVGREVYEKGKQLGHAVNPFVEKGEQAALNPLLHLFGEKYETQQEVAARKKREYAWMHPQPNLEQALGKIELRLHAKVDIDGKQVGESRSVVQGIEKVQREHQNRK